MRGLLRFFLFLGFMFVVLFASSNSIFACSPNQYGECTGTCAAGFRCEQTGYGVCTCEYIIPTATPRPPTNTPTPEQCQNNCTNEYLPGTNGIDSCEQQTGDIGSFPVCNYVACPNSWACTVDTSLCSVWSDWTCTNDGLTETRYCISPQQYYGDAQARQPCSGSGPTPTHQPGTPPNCDAWDSININNCTQAGWQSTPKSPNCITGTRTGLTLYLSSSGATQMAFSNAVDTGVVCNDIANGDYSNPQAYATSRAWNLSTGYENKKVCARFINANGDAKCGALIQYTAPTPTITPSPTPTAYLRVRTYKQVDLSNQVASTLCKVNCAAPYPTPCIYNNAGNPCQSNLAVADFVIAGSQFNRGGGMYDPNFKVIGVTPLVDGAVSDTGIRTDCDGVGNDGDCYYWTTQKTTGSRVVRFVVVSVTPTPTNTPTPAAWVRIKDTSFVSVNALTNEIPQAPLAYDGDDPNTGPYFTVGDSGLVAAPGISLTGMNANAKTGDPEYSAVFTPAPYAMTPTTFLGYVRARKQFTQISSISEIEGSGIYVISGDLDLSSVPSEFNANDVVLISTGTITISAATFIPTRSQAIIAPNIIFGSNVTEAKGIFIGNSVSTGSNGLNPTLGLKIVGNLVAQGSLAQGRRLADNSRPAVFVVFEPDIYSALLPYLSTANYEWKQLQ